MNSEQYRTECCSGLWKMNKAGTRWEGKRWSMFRAKEEAGPVLGFSLNLLLPSRSAHAGWVSKAILPVTLFPTTATNAGAIHLST